MNLENLILKRLIQEADKDEKVGEPKEEDPKIPVTPEMGTGKTFEDNPMEFILRKYHSLNELMTELMTDSFKDFVDAIFVAAPKPTTFKIILHNGQSFILTYLGKAYEATVSGKNYYLSHIGEKERCMIAISRLLRSGSPIKSKGPEGAEQGTRSNTGMEGDWAEKVRAAGGSTGGAEEVGAEGEASEETGGEETGGEELKESKILKAILKEVINFFPKSEEEITNDSAKELFSLLKKNTTIPDPIGLDPKNPKVAKITRKLQNDKKVVSAINKATGQDISTPGSKVKYKGITVSFGEGSRGGRGEKSKGLGFENTLEGDLNRLKQEGYDEQNKDSFGHPAIIEKMVKELGLQKGNFTVIPEGKKNQSRPLKVTEDGLEISHAGETVAETLTDLTIEKDNGKKYYLSLKYGGTLTFFNSGISKMLPAEEIKSGKIKNANGKLLLSMLGIDPKKFCDVFNNYGKRGNFGSQEVSRVDQAKLSHLVSSGLGDGYYYVQAGKGEDKFFKVDKKYNKIASEVNSVATILYGGADGKSKRVDITFTTQKYRFKLTIRNKGGGVYPTHIMCDYKEKSL